MTRMAVCLKSLLAVTIALGGICWLNSPAKAQGSRETVYKAKCASCHGADGKGATPAGKATKARDFCSEEVQKESDEEWTTIIAKGKNKMPSYDKKLSEAEIKEAVTYIRSFCKK